ncbi:MAG: hypothetical protein ACJAZV_001370 [Roseivirga sp.]|jgi:hypothetical protein
MTIRTILSTCALLVLLSCQNQTVQSFDEALDANTELELKNDTDLIIAFFQSQIMDSTDIKSDTYSIFNNFRMAIANQFWKNDDFDFPIDFTAQRAFYQKLSWFFFTDTWGYGTSRFSNDSITYLSINLRVESAILQLIKQRNLDDPFISNYLSTLSAAGDISPSNVGNMALILTSEDLKKPEVRLLMALHYLTLNDRAKRRDPI